MLTGHRKVPYRKASSKSRKFTLIGLTALTGEPVMCVIIIEGKNPNPTIEAGMDIRVSPIGNSHEKDYMQKNRGQGKFFPGGPTCKFKNKDVPAFICWHESGSITSQVLTEVLQTLDLFYLFPHNNPFIKPFVLLGGHCSRLEIPFLSISTDQRIIGSFVSACLMARHSGRLEIRRSRTAPSTLH